MAISEPRERLLRTASELFYREGIHAVGVDRIVGEAGVTRATFYRHFPGKEDLVEAYLGVEDSHIRSAFASAGDQSDDPRRLLELIADPDTAKAQRAMASMMTMQKIDIAAIEAAAAGAPGRD